MKKYIVAGLLIALTLVLCHTVFGAEYGAPSDKPGVRVNFAPETGVKTLLSAVTATGVGDAVDLGFVTSKLTCQVTWGGAAPTSTLVNIWGTLDNVTWPANTTTYYLDQQTITATGGIFHIASKPVRYLKGEFVSKVGGNGTSAVTVKCGGGGN